MPDLLPNLGLPLLVPSQAQKHVSHNEALRILDTLVQLVVQERTRTTPPPDPVPGARYLVAPGAEGAWAGQDQMIALFEAGAWLFFPPQPGWIGYDASTAETLQFDGSHWGPLPLPAEINTLAGLGVNTTADPLNRLSVRAPATLFSHEGAGHQLKINKASAADTASLLFQSNWGGRAEMGLAGSDNWSVKVSPDGASWQVALALEAATGLASGTAVQSSPEDTTPGRLMRADYGYGPGNVVGPVTQSGGVPTGALVDQGETPEGRYTRWADGTQICWAVQEGLEVTTADGALYRSAELSHTFPLPFVAPPVTSGSCQTGGGWGNIRALSATAWGATLWAPTQVSAAEVTVLAVGRWY